MASHGAFLERSMKNWVKLSFVGPGDPPDRNSVGTLLLQSQWISVQDIYSFIGLPNRKDFEICFTNERALRVFLDLTSSNQEKWVDFQIYSPINQDIKTLIVKFWTGRICDADVEMYLRRYCEILKPVEKPVDNLGFWYGVRKYKVKLRRDANGQVMGIPNSILLGPYNGTIFYQGQVSRCFVCQSTDHQVKECQSVKCWQCGEFGHKSKECKNNAICNLCGIQGHSFFNCPKSYANRFKNNLGRIQPITTEKEPEIFPAELPTSAPKQSTSEGEPREDQQPRQPKENIKNKENKENSKHRDEEKKEGLNRVEEEEEESSTCTDGSVTSSESDTPEEMEGESYESATDEDFSADSLSPVTKEKKEQQKQQQKNRRGHSAATLDEDTVVEDANYKLDTLMDYKRKRDSSTENEGTRETRCQPGPLPPRKEGKKKELKHVNRDMN